MIIPKVNIQNLQKKIKGFFLNPIQSRFSVKEELKHL